MIGYVFVETGSEEKLKDELEQFLKDAEQLLITSARDLAVLTQYGINARKIVSLSLICERLQRIRRKEAFQAADITAIRDASRELLLGLGGICHKVKQISGKIRRAEYMRFKRNMDHWWRSLGTIC